MTPKTDTESHRVSARAEIEAAPRPPRPTFADAMRHQNRTESEIASAGLTPTAISNVLATAGLDPSNGLQGVPKSREGHVCSLLTACYRSGS